MCDHRQLPPALPICVAGDIDHVHSLSENIGALFQNEDYADVTLVVGDSTRFKAHKVILASRSEFFRALLYGGLRESQPGCDEVELKDVHPQPFEVLLKYIYTGKVNLHSLREDVLLDALGLAHRYGFAALENAASDFLRATLATRNVCLVYDLASLYQQSALAAACLDFIDHNAADILRSDGFFALSQSALIEVIRRSSFCAPEVDIFQAVVEWAARDPDHDAGPVVTYIRLPLMKLEELLNIVRPTQLVAPDSILDAIKTQSESRNTQLNYRGLLLHEENVAVPSRGARVVHGEMKGALLDGDTLNYDLDRGFSRHPIDDAGGNAGGSQGIVVCLGHPTIINTIRILLWDKDTRSYAYYIEVSVDEKDWVKVVDHSKYLCRSWQTLHFQQRVVRYIRVVGTHNSVNRVFHVVALEALYTSKPFHLRHGLIVPTENVATISHSACVVEGVSRSRNALINGDTKNYDWDSGYTCHQLGSGAIVVQLAQPYVIGSMRLLLWDCDDRSYSYTVEVSLDQIQWEIVADRRDCACKSWQLITFPPRAFAFIRIIGTRNTANEVFHCVHFECPADSRFLLQSVSSSPSPDTSRQMARTDGSTAIQLPFVPSEDPAAASAAAAAAAAAAAVSSPSRPSANMTPLSSSLGSLQGISLVMQDD